MIYSTNLLKICLSLAADTLAELRFFVTSTFLPLNKYRVSGYLIVLHPLNKKQGLHISEAERTAAELGMNK